MIPKHHILLLGSGLMAEAVVIQLLKRKENKIHIASNIVEDAKKIAEKYPANLTYSEVDVMKRQSIEPLVSAAELVISYIPAFLHIHVARMCLELKKNMVTSSYVTKQLKELHESVKDADLVFLNEIGLDPGIDHLSTMKVIDQVHSKGGKIVEYESWCGGLPSPQFCDNPLGYKFTWSPIGALKALNNDAKFIQFGKEYVTDSKDLLYNIFHVQINPALSFDGYANRDSVNYKEVYGLKDAQKVMRGTLRYRGFCTIMAAFKQLGLLKDEKPHGATWVEHFNLTLKDEEVSPLNKNEVAEELRDVVGKIVHKTIYHNIQYQDLSNEEKAKKAKIVISALKFFDLLNPLVGFNKPEESLIENLVHLLEPKLKLKQGEADLIAMQHIFKIEYPNKPIVTHKSSLLMIGDKHGQSAMSRTVGSPAAIGAQLILDGKIKGRGVIIPTEKELYEPVLQQLELSGIKLIDTEQ